MEKSPQLKHEDLAFLFRTGNKEHLEYRLSECLKTGLLQSTTEELLTSEGNLEDKLDSLLQKLAKNKSVLLADSQGLCIVSNGFTSEISEEISVLSVEIAALHQRRARPISKKLNIDSCAWSITNISGASCLGFWPLYIGAEKLALVIEGEPNLQQPALTTLIWMLYTRYGKNKQLRNRRKKK